jgi:hypothetical protein
MQSGHYVAAVQGPAGRWFECDDARVRPARAGDVLRGELAAVAPHETFAGASRTAYILVYHRRVP